MLNLAPQVFISNIRIQKSSTDEISEGSPYFIELKTHMKSFSVAICLLAINWTHFCLSYSLHRDEQEYTTET